MTTRVLYRDVIPYDIPSSLAVLGAPPMVCSPCRSPFIGDPHATADLSTANGLEKAYENLVREGTTQQQEEFLNADLLRRVWPHLRLPIRCRDRWETRFPQLATR